MRRILEAATDVVLGDGAGRASVFTVSATGGAGPLGRNADYDASSLYYGPHFGTGYVWNITEAVSPDLYGKYFWTRQQGDSVTLSTNDPVKFKDADSHRLRGGARFSYAVNEYVSPYIGAAYEHEFDGRVSFISLFI